MEPWKSPSSWSGHEQKEEAGRCCTAVTNNTSWRDADRPGEQGGPATWAAASRLKKTAKESVEYVVLGKQALCVLKNPSCPLPSDKPRQNGVRTGLLSPPAAAARKRCEEGTSNITRPGKTPEHVAGKTDH